jgi:hypothetical protein
MNYESSRAVECCPEMFHFPILSWSVRFCCLLLNVEAFQYLAELCPDRFKFVWLVTVGAIERLYLQGQRWE